MKDRLMEQAEALQLRTPDCEHNFPPAIRKEAYRFIEQAFDQAKN